MPKSYLTYREPVKAANVGKTARKSWKDMQKVLINNQPSGGVACARQIISLAGIAADSSFNNRVRKI